MISCYLRYSICGSRVKLCIFILFFFNRITEYFWWSCKIKFSFCCFISLNIGCVLIICCGMFKRKAIGLEGIFWYLEVHLTRFCLKSIKLFQREVRNRFILCLSLSLSTSLVHTSVVVLKILYLNDCNSLKYGE